MGCLQSLMEYFNRWAYVYVGIYGYNFTKAGKAVFELFKQRGFDAIINDDLIGNVLGFAALGIGTVCPHEFLHCKGRVCDSFCALSRRPHLRCGWSRDRRDD